MQLLVALVIAAFGGATGTVVVKTTNNTTSNMPSFFTWYDADARGQHSFSNLIWDRDLNVLDIAFHNYSMPGMWSITTRCNPGQQIYGEPYCGGKTGLVPSWKSGVAWAVQQIVNRSHIVGIFLGDEPEIAGIPGTQMCELALYFKNALINISRGDVFLYYNDAVQGSFEPSFVRNKKLCRGLDYVSIDSYNDDPATEVENAARAYSGITLNAPNKYERKGQGLFLVPGIFWYIQPDPLKPEPIASPAWLVQKMRLHWEYARKTPGIVGINPWHWADRPGMTPPNDCFARGAASMLGGNATTPGSLAQWYAWIGANISGANISGADIAGADIAGGRALT